LLDVWAGVSSFSEGFYRQSHVTVKEFAWIEWAAEAAAALEMAHGVVLNCRDFYSYAWKGWKFQNDLVVTAGPSCCPFSVSGKRLRHADPRSGQGMDTALLAVVLGALTLIVENVVNFVDEDYLHSLVNDMDAYLLLHGMVAIGIWRLADYEMGGGTGRERVFLRWEREDMASSLPSLEPEPIPRQPSCVLDFVDEKECVSSMVLPNTSEVEIWEVFDIHPTRATQVGVVRVRGPASKWMLGEGLKLKGDHRVWRVIEFDGDCMKIIFDNRRSPKFRWVHRESVKLSQRHPVEWPVYSMCGLAKAIRHTSFAPGDLYWDHRLGPEAVRALSGREKWRLMGLGEERAAELVDAGLENHIGALAGNSIPTCMTQAVAESEGARIRRFRELLRCKAAGTYTLMPPIAALHTKALSLTVLIFVGLAAADVLVWNGSEIPGMVHEVSQQQAFTKACSWARGLGCECTDHCILLEQEMGQSTARAIIYYDQELPTVSGAVAKPISGLLHLPVGDLAVQALLQVERMVKQVHVGMDEERTWRSGRVSGTASFEAEEATCQGCDADAFEEEVQRHDCSIETMRQILREDGSDEMLTWEARLSPTDMADFPPALKRKLQVLDWCGIPVPDPHVPVETEWLPLPKKQELEPMPAPLRWLSAVRKPFRQEAKRRVDSFRHKLTMWMRGASQRPSPVVIPGDWLEHWVFEAPHEFHSRPGWAVPVDCSEPSKSHLNLDFFQMQGAEYPDQEIISFLVLGVRYKADLPVQIVLQPHLQSFLPVQDKYLEESDRFVGRGWTVCGDSLLIVPFFSAACGSVCRPLEPDRPRCTNDAGAPRRELWADDGIRVRSLNECISEVIWPKEIKPNALDVMIALRVLKEAADLLGLSVFILTDDYKSFFNQMRLCKSEYAKTGAMHPPRPGQEQAGFAYDTVLGFGIKMASNVAQRFADFLVSIFRRALKPEMDRLIARYRREYPDFDAWVKARQGVSGSGDMAAGDWLQEAICHMFMYCDDPCILCVGEDMAYGALKVWNWMAKEGRTLMAIPEKRSFGLSSKWIGIKFFSALGVGALPAQKALRACSQMHDATCQSLNRDQYRSLLGFLEHVRAVLFLRADKMYGLYDVLNQELEPMDLIPCNDLMQKQFHRMSQRVIVQAGSSVADLPAFVSGAPLPKVQKQVAARRWALFSDAAKEGTDKPGLGGWFLGYHWRVALNAEHLRLDIPILEAIAAVVNVIVAHDVLGGTDCLPAGACFEAHVDAQATAHVLLRGKARSPMMQMVHSIALQYTAFRDMLPFLVVKHCFGLGNVASDAASRGYDDVLQKIAAALSINLIKIEPPQVAILILEQCVLCVGKQKHEFCWGASGTRFGDADHPGPIFQPMESRIASNENQGMVDSSVKAVKRHGVFQPMESRQVRHRAEPQAPPVGAARSTAMYPRADGPLTPTSLARMLWNDNSGYSICSGNWEQLLECCDVALCTAAEAFAERTAAADIGHWRAWQQYCSSVRADPNRPAIDPSDKLGFLREIVLLTNALVHFMKTRKPRSRADTVIKPQSAMNILLGANRVMRATFGSFIPLSNLKLPLKGLMRKFVQRFGPTSLVPKRREPFTNGMVVTLCTLPLGYDLGAVGQLTQGSLLRASWRGAVAIANSSGFRKAELFQSNNTTHFLKWANLTWIISGTPVASPSDSQLSGLNDRDYLAVTPVPSKADQFNTVWGAHPLYLPFREGPRNAAAAIRDLALSVGATNRAADKPVFVGNDQQPLRASQMATAMYRAMHFVVGAATAKLYTWHSARISLATHLLKCNVPAATIQALLRWQTDESLRAYARLSMTDCGQLLDRAARANIATVQTANLPLYEQFDFFLALHEMAEAT
jgi:site-specific DNA-cytosine methylase